MGGRGGASLDWDRRRGVTAVQTTSQEAWPEADLGDEILPEVRAAVERRQACALQKGARRIARCGGFCPPVARPPLPSIFCFFSACSCVTDATEYRNAGPTPSPSPHPNRSPLHGTAICSRP